MSAHNEKPPGIEATADCPRGKEDTKKEDWLKTEYQEVCKSYQAIIDFRAKLLGFLPLASSGVFLLLDRKIEDLPSLLPLGLYGAAVTFGCAAYEARGMNLCHALVCRGKCIEESMGMHGGMFKERPEPQFPPFRATVAAIVIYLATLVAWGYVAYTGYEARPNTSASRRTSQAPRRPSPPLPIGSRMSYRGT